MKQAKWLRWIRCALCKIHLVDKCLLVFMTVLLLQSAYSLISGGGAFPESDHIDVIVRTSTAGIFGYFLSANFIHHSALDKNVEVKAPRQKALNADAAASGDTPRARIGFAAPDSLEASEIAGVEITTEEATESVDVACLQILTAAGIGLFCLIVLILVRNFAPWDNTISPSATATVAQLRDFVSGSVGFLLGSPTSGRTEKG